VPCTGGYQFGNRYFRAAGKKGHGSLDLEARSSTRATCTSYQLGLKIGLGIHCRESSSRCGQVRNRSAGEDQARFPYAIDYYNKNRCARME